jgi:biotin operon repressor
MFNADFWEVRLDPGDLDRYAADAALWATPAEDETSTFPTPARQVELLAPVMEVIRGALTERQQQALLLYYLQQKTQEEIAAILGISRRVVSQHLFGICRNGRRVGGALAKVRRLCHQRGLALVAPPRGPSASRQFGDAVTARPTRASCIRA